MNDNLQKAVKKLSSAGAAKMFVDAGRNIDQLKIELNKFDDDLANISMNDEELMAHKHASDLTRIKIKQQVKRRNQLEGIVLEKIKKEDQDKLPQIADKLAGLEEEKTALAKKLLTHAVTVEVIDHHIDKYPKHVYRDISVDLRRFCETEKERIKTELGIAEPSSSIVAQIDALVDERNQINFRKDYSIAVSDLISKISTD